MIFSGLAGESVMDVLAGRASLKDSDPKGGEGLGDLTGLLGSGSTPGLAAAGGARERVVAVAESTLTSRTGFKRYSQVGKLTDDPTPPAPARTDCSQWLRACFLQAGLPDIGTYTVAQMAKSKRTNNPQPGDILIGTGHVELYVGNGKTIGHGSPPIDYGEADYYVEHMGLHYRTFGFFGTADPNPVRRGQNRGFAGRRR